MRIKTKKNPIKNICLLKFKKKKLYSFIVVIISINQCAMTLKASRLLSDKIEMYDTLL